MAEWVSHLIVADKVLEKFPQLSRHEFCVGNIAPDCNIPNEDWTEFTPPRAVTHWMQDNRKKATDCVRFYDDLDEHPDSGYFTEIKGLEEFPDYIDYLPKGAIPMKVKMMYYMPTLEEGRYPFVGFSREEYEGFLERAVNNVINAIEALVTRQL